MGLDPNIALSYRPTPLENPVNQYAQALQIQNAGTQNKLAQLQYDQALKAQATDQEVSNVFARTGTDLAAAREALMRGGHYKQAMALDEAARKKRLEEAQINEKDIKAAKDRLDAFSGLIAPLAQKPNITHDDIFTAGERAELLGLVPKGWRASVPMNAMHLSEYVKGLALSTEQGRKSLEMLLPKVSLQDTGGAVTPFNTNTLAGPVGPLAGVAPTPKTMSLAENAADERARAQFEEQKRHNRVTEKAAQEGKEASAGKAQVDIEGKLRDDYTKASKDFVSVRDAHQRVMESANEPSAAGDLALIFNYMKVLDPGSTVREGEFATAQNAGGVGDRIISMYNRVLRGERLTDDQRADFVKRSGSLYKGAEKNQEKLEKEYEGIAKRSGARVENVVIRSRVEPPAPKMPKAGDLSNLSDEEIKKRLGL